VKILALITARAGSKRVPGKNVRPLAGVPLLAWSIAAAQDLPDVCDILVSTDDEQIAEVARSAGALVPWLRPQELSGDAAGSVDVALHALSRYETDNGPVDGLLLLQPTSPFRRRETVARGITTYVSAGMRPVVGMSPARSHPLWCFRLDEGRPVPFCGEGGMYLRSQELPLAYIVNGAFYLISPHSLRERKSFYASDMVPLLMDDPREGIDIDTEWDWKIAEAAAEMKE